jgi:hypothetical protein
MSLNDRTHASQVAHSFLAHVADKPYVARCMYAQLLEGARKRQ